MAHNRAFPVAAVILGAGAGKRFGQPKAGALLDDGRTFLDAICATARDAMTGPIIAVVPPGARVPAGVTTIENPKPDGEQIASLRLALSQLTNTPSVGALAWPVDHPFVSLESVLVVIDAARRSGAPVARPEFEGEHGHPVFFHRDAWRELMTVASGGARAVVHSYGSRVASVTVRDRGVLRDIDYLEDMKGR